MSSIETKLESMLAQHLQQRTCGTADDIAAELDAYCLAMRNRIAAQFDGQNDLQQHAFNALDAARVKVEAEANARLDLLAAPEHVQEQVPEQVLEQAPAQAPEQTMDQAMAQAMDQSMAQALPPVSAEPTLVPEPPAFEPAPSPVPDVPLEGAQARLSAAAPHAEASPAPAPAAPIAAATAPQPKTKWAIVALAAVGGALITFLAMQALGPTALLSATGSIPKADRELARTNALAVRDFVERFETEIQKPASSVSFPNANQFHNVRRLWTEEYDKLPASARYQLILLARKNGDAYKIVVQSPFCPVAVEEKILQPDPRRKNVYSTLCTVTARWNEGGKDF
ncbi:MAG: hypothetical protein AAGM04_00520 [Pseudomonadota bacterium]